MITTLRRYLVVAALLLVSGCALVGVTPAESPHRPAHLLDTENPNPIIGLLLPETTTARYESADRPIFTQTVQQRCPTCVVHYANAEQDASLQLQQAESMLSAGVSVLVLDAVDTASAATIVANAHRLGVPVIAYDRFLSDVDYYVSFDSQLVGYFMARSVVDFFDSRGSEVENPHILVVMGSTTDPNTAALKTGIDRAIAGSDLDVVATYYTPDWSPELAALWVETQLTLQPDPIHAVVAANDALASGVISAFKAAGVSPLPIVTGQDGELAAVQRMLAGDQHMTVFKAAQSQARTAAEYAVALAFGQSPRATAMVEDVPATLLTPQPVYAGTVARIIIDGGLYTVDDICTPHYQDFCDHYELFPSN